MEYHNPNLSPKNAHKITDIEKQFILMRAKGVSIRDISKALKKSSRTICEWNKKFSPNILFERNKSFCELQKKVIELKNDRIDFVKQEIERISSFLKKCKVVDIGFGDNYDIVLNRFIKLSDLLTAYENDVLSVGINFKDNIEPETNINEEDATFENTVFSDKTQITLNSDEKVIDNKEVNNVGKQNFIGNTLPKKYFNKKTVT